jgi:type I restriction enzyme R subunit
MKYNIKSQNFHFMSAYGPKFERLGALAEHYFTDDPNTCLIKLRQFAEVLAQEVAARSGLFESSEEAQSDLLRRLRVERAVPQQVIELFHQVRLAGNRATHALTDDHSTALTNMKIARELAIWFHRGFGRAASFNAGPFVPPERPTDATAALQEELERLRGELAASLNENERRRTEAEAAVLARETAEERALRIAEERETWELLAEEAETARNALATELLSLQAAAQSAPPPEKRQTAQFVEQAAEAVQLDEASTRALIDRQLRDRGWEVDTQQLTYASGTRPARGRNLAIAEWPTESGPADYALFVGEQCVGTVEAKRYRKNVSAAIDQAERYATGIRHVEADTFGEEGFRVPFVFATNGRPYLQQLETESGIWFRDLRRGRNLRRALLDWYTPDELYDQLSVDKDAAQKALAARPFDFGFELRPYQRAAIEAVETALAGEERRMLLAMATGTGKTKLAIAMLYRLLATRRFRRVCFVVDRSALGTQSKDEFMSTAIEGPKTFGQLFGIKGLEDTTADAETRVHICTIQGLVKRVLYSDPAAMPTIGEYDLIVVDECHRGYLLDREMSDAELSFRSQDEYVSKYRRVLDYFDAVKVGLTATPALHTVQIFGEPIYTYSYREAVVDGWLIDHEPPIRFTTALAEAGIVFEAGSDVEALDSRTGTVANITAPDELAFQVEGFNRRVITQEFNRVVAEELAKHIDPSLDGKTLIFAATDAHADIVVNELKKAFAARYGEIEDAAIRKVTGSVDHVGKLIRSFRNDAFPQIAVTVDLLTTGIDVPKITNLVFIRRVNSRILYEQMLGRATRRCDEIGKELFRIFDAVDLYASLEDVTQMRPVASNPSLTFAQLFDELATVGEDDQRALVRDQLLAKLHRRLRKLPSRSADEIAALTGESPQAVRERLAAASPAEAAEFARQYRDIGPMLDWQPEGGEPLFIPISHHEDEMRRVSVGYGQYDRPQDFLDTFSSFVRNNQNAIAALNVVVQRPRELTREQLRAVRLELDRMGFSEATLRRAWNDASNQDIAASIIGYIRQAALGDPLIPFAARVHQATQAILAKGSWTQPQRTWLSRIAEQIQREIVVDRTAIDQGTFAAQGGFTRLNRIFDGRLEAILSDFNEELWKKTA